MKGNQKVTLGPRQPGSALFSHLVLLTNIDQWTTRPDQERDQETKGLAAKDRTKGLEAPKDLWTNEPGDLPFEQAKEPVQEAEEPADQETKGLGDH